MNNKIIDFDYYCYTPVQIKDIKIQAVKQYRRKQRKQKTDNIKLYIGLAIFYKMTIAMILHWFLSGY